jgi:predicted nucleotidyltransferase
VNKNQKNILEQLFIKQSNINFAFLFGSRANGNNNHQSDWDFAVWINNPSDIERLIEKEQLRQQLAKLLKTNIDKIDIVDLQSASLSIMSSVVEDGIILKGDGLLELNLFYKRIWSLEEDFYWRLQYENRTLSS